MKPNTSSKYFKLSILSLGLFIGHLFVLQAQVKSVIMNGAGDLPSLYFYLPYLWVCLSGLLFIKSTKKGQSVHHQLLAFLLTPLILSPILGVLYVLIILLPIYGLAGQSFSQ